MLEPDEIPYGMRWLEPRLKELRKTGAEFGRAVGVPKQRVYEMYKGKRQLQADEIKKAAHFLEWSEAELTERIAAASRTHPNGHDSVTPLPPPQSATPKSNVRYLDQQRKPPLRSEMAKDVPVLGTVSGGGGGVIMASEAIDWVRRPPQLEGRKDIFALYVEDVSMVPRYGPGDLIYIEGRPAANGDHVVVEFKGEDGELRAILKKLKAKTGTMVKLEQYNPPKVIEIALVAIIAIKRVMTTMDILGV